MLGRWRLRRWITRRGNARHGARWTGRWGRLLPRPLSDVETGARAVVNRVIGGREFNSRMASLGFTPGAEVAVVQNYGHGPIIVSVRDTRVALGHGEALKVLVDAL